MAVVVDRRELETQMVQNLEAFGFPMVERARRKSHLRQLVGARRLTQHGRGRGVEVDLPQ